MRKQIIILLVIIMSLNMASASAAYSECERYGTCESITPNRYLTSEIDPIWSLNETLFAKLARDDVITGLWTFDETQFTSDVPITGQTLWQVTTLNGLLTVGSFRVTPLYFQFVPNLLPVMLGNDTKGFFLAADSGNVEMTTGTGMGFFKHFNNVLAYFNKTGFFFNSTTHFDKNTTLNNIYGEIWGQHIGEITISTQNMYYNVTNTTAGLNNGFKHNVEGQGGLTADFDGVYKITSQWSFSNGANTEYHIAAGINGERSTKCHAERKLGTGGDVGSASYTCLVRLNVGDTITAMIENADNVADPEVHDIQLNILRVGN